MRRLLVLAVLLGCGSSSSTTPGDDDDDGSGGGSAVGCDGTPLLANPSDLAAPGPWPVGARTVKVGGLTVEVWYPATPGSAEGKSPERYDIRTHLPPSEVPKIPDADNPWQTCDCVRDLPLDDKHGPYPVVVFVHGTASFRHQSLHQTTHWASRGFVVVAADHPGLQLGDMLAMACGGSAPAQNLSGDIDAVIAALGQPAGDLAFLGGHIDMTRVAITGHSAGASAAAGAATKPGVKVVVSMAGNKATTTASSLYLGGLADSVVSWGQVKTAYDGAAKPRRLVGITDGGHLTFSDLCQTKNSSGKDLLQVANDYQICGAQLASFLFDCDPSHIAGPAGWDIVNYASSAVLESTLQCQPPVSLSSIKTTYSAVAEYNEAL
ncbi:MAG TPA: hypothetical protein VIV40_31875 [Kofleriaceae bacterium]